MTVMVDQKTIFSDRLKRIQSGKQYEHADIIGHSTQKRYNKIFGKKNKKPKRTFADKMMVLIAFLCGMSSVLVGRVAYFHLAKLDGLPPAFYDLGGRGMVLFSFVLAMILVAIFHLSNRARFQALAGRLRGDALRRSGRRLERAGILVPPLLGGICRDHGRTGPRLSADAGRLNPTQSEIPAARALRPSAA